MQKIIDARELIELDTAYGVVRGTYHKPRNIDLELLARTSQQDRVGILFLNSLVPTRAATGDSAVYWAESFAKNGYPSFRLDLPGFGDSDGELPVELLHFVDTGGFAPAASVQIDEITKRFHLSGVIVIGLCAGAVSAVYSAAANAQCKGIVLLDPYFHLPLVAVKGSSVWRKARKKLTEKVSQGIVGKLISEIRNSINKVFPGNPLPSNANTLLLACWKDIVSKRLPVLVLKAPQIKLKIIEFDYLGFLCERYGSKSQIMIEEIQGTDHSFSNITGREAVREHSQKWLNTYFPLYQQEKVSNVLQADHSENTVHNRVAAIRSTTDFCIGK
jgi:pimeloyl-ACP methyl ester carboxylesterase